LEVGSLVGVLAVFALVAVNGFFVAAEFGLVSLPVQDEFDTLEEGVCSEVEMQADGSYSVDGLITVDAFAEKFAVSFGNAHYHTIAGYVLAELGRVPKVDDSVYIGEYRLQVEAMDHLRIAACGLSVLNTLRTFTRVG